VTVLKIINQTINSMISSKEYQWNEAIAYEAVIRMIDDEDINEMSVGR
jgi:hypothetical protein